jgi:hypothetical protein
VERETHAKCEKTCKIGALIHLDLWVKKDEKDQLFKLQAPYAFTKAEWPTLLQRLDRIRLPIGYGGAMKKHICNKKFGSLKSHDYHILMQQVLPVCL